ncbi:MAG: TRZ/ATZ family hydrolase [Gammaproteobacteria bacterium]|nr:TRZ/ATZ family hydrolase [Gammaproteobacteria bacterium]
MESVSQIIHARWLITGEQNNQTLENHAIVIDQGKIKAILPSKQATERYTATDIQRFPNHVISPGFVNTHTHIAMNYFRGLADDLALMDWLNHHIWPAERTWVSQEFVRDASQLAIAEMIRSGTTCFNDMYFFLQATAEVADQAGIRANIGMTVIDFPTAWAKDTAEYFSKGIEFYSEYKNHDRIKATVAPHAIYTVAEPTLLKVKEIAEKYDLKINMHVHETADEINQSIATTKQRPLRRLQNIGLVTPRLIAIHMTQLDDEDMAIIEAGKPNIVHCPESNMKLASGACPVVALQKQGLNVALGTDGAASNNDLNMLGEMRSANFLAKLVTQNPIALPAHETITMATLNGAKALGLDHITGSLTVGKAADFIATKLDEIETLPIYHPASHLVYAASRNQVTDVWVAGKQLMKKRKLLTLDEKEIKAKAIYWSKKLTKNA